MLLHLVVKLSQFKDVAGAILGCKHSVISGGPRLKVFGNENRRCSKKSQQFTLNMIMIMIIAIDTTETDIAVSPPICYLINKQKVGAHPRAVSSADKM